jgi:hypothetical protein
MNRLCLWILRLLKTGRFGTLALIWILFLTQPDQLSQPRPCYAVGVGSVWMMKHLLEMAGLCETQLVLSVVPQEYEYLIPAADQEEESLLSTRTEAQKEPPYHPRKRFVCWQLRLLSTDFVDQWSTDFVDRC